MENKKIKVKLILVGNGKVGKTSLITQYLDKTFTENYIMTIGKEKTIKKINIDGKEVTLEICDTAGQEEFKLVNKIFMKNTDIALIVYDITNRKSFEELTNWIYSVNQSNGNQNVIFGIAANKSDLYEQKVINKKEGEEFAKNNNALFFETSAKDYDSVENVFLTLTEQYLKNKEEEKKPFENISNSNISSVNGNVNDEDIEIDPSCSSSKCFLF
jgi:small GTP-binding protein